MMVLALTKVSGQSAASLCRSIVTVPLPRTSIETVAKQLISEASPFSTALAQITATSPRLEQRYFPFANVKVEIAGLNFSSRCLFSWLNADGEVSSKILPYGGEVAKKVIRRCFFYTGHSHYGSLIQAAYKNYPQNMIGELVHPPESMIEWPAPDKEQKVEGIAQLFFKEWLTSILKQDIKLIRGAEDVEIESLTYHPKIKIDQCFLPGFAYHYSQEGFYGVKVIPG